MNKMTKRNEKCLLSLGLGLSMGLTMICAASAAEWSHDPGSRIGTAYWGEVTPSFRTCGSIIGSGTDFQETGTRQSPIDIPESAVAGGGALPPLHFLYRATPLKVKNNGHVIEVPYQPGSHLLVGTERYELVQFHFHTPSEHTTRGRKFEMELHAVHRNSLGELAVVGALMQSCRAGDDGCAANPAFDAILNNAPEEEGEREVEGESVNARSLLPRGTGYYRYAGSLTTPPCSEGVRWFVLSRPVRVSEGAVERMRELVSRFPTHNGYAENSRPVRPLNDRPVLHRHH